MIKFNQSQILTIQCKTDVISYNKIELLFLTVNIFGSYNRVVILKIMLAVLDLDWLIQYGGAEIRQS